jgi:hypothetical protein
MQVLPSPYEYTGDSIIQYTIHQLLGRQYMSKVNYKYIHVILAINAASHLMFKKGCGRRHLAFNLQDSRASYFILLQPE